MTVTSSLAVMPPVLCIPWIPRGLGLPKDLAKLFEDLYGLTFFNIEGGAVLGKKHDAFFFHPNPGVLLPEAYELYEMLEANIPVKIYVNESFYFHVCLSNHEHHRKVMEPVGPEYYLWDGTGSYDDFVLKVEAAKAAEPEPEIRFGDFDDE
jgi:hypothetical protein